MSTLAMPLIVAVAVLLAGGANGESLDGISRFVVGSGAIETIAQAGKGTGKSGTGKPGAASQGTGKASGGPPAANERGVLDAMYAASETLQALRDDRSDVRSSIEPQMLSLFDQLSADAPDSDAGEIAVFGGLMLGIAFSAMFEGEYMRRGRDAEVIAYHRHIIAAQRAIADDDPVDCFDAIAGTGSAVHAATTDAAFRETDRRFADLVRSAVGRPDPTSVGRNILVEAAKISDRVVAENDIDMDGIDAYLGGAVDQAALPNALKADMCLFTLRFGEMVLGYPDAIAADLVRWGHMDSDSDSDSAGGGDDRSATRGAPGKP